MSENAFSNRIVDMWNSLSEYCITRTALNEFKTYSRTGIGNLKVTALLTRK